MSTCTTKEIKEVDKKGLDFIAQEEGCILKPYRDSVGIPTIGIGCTYYEGGKRVQMTDPPITKTRALQLFKNVLKTYEKINEASVNSYFYAPWCIANDLFS